MGDFVAQPYYICTVLKAFCQRLILIITPIVMLTNVSLSFIDSINSFASDVKSETIFSKSSSSTVLDLPMEVSTLELEEAEESFEELKETDNGFDSFVQSFYSASGANIHDNLSRLKECQCSLSFKYNQPAYLVNENFRL